MLGRPRDLMPKRIERKILKDENGCWLWTGQKDRGGYGRIGITENGRCFKRLAHRLSYEAFVGPIPKGLEIDHLCRVHCCVNPAHLEPVTRNVNMQRGVNIGLVGRLAADAKQRAKTTCKHGHDYTPDNLRWSQKGKYLTRYCLLCMKLRHRARRAKQKIAAVPPETIAR